ncbi:MAG: hypothetical protein WC091_15595 [Sulfuricellaceae bacterium]
MSNLVEPSSEALFADPLNFGEYAYGLGTPVFKVFEAPPSASPADADETALMGAEVPFAAFSPIATALPPLPDGVIPSPSLDLSFLTQPGHLPMPSLKLAEATQPDPSSGVSPAMPSSPDVHPTEMPATPVSTGVAETNANDANALSGLAPVNVTPPAPSAIETPPAPVAAPPGPIAGDPNVAVGQLPTGAALPSGAVGTAPIHPAPQLPDSAGIHVMMSRNLAEQMTSVLQDVLRGKAP